MEPGPRNSGETGNATAVPDRTDRAVMPRALEVCDVGPRQPQALIQNVEPTQAKWKRAIDFPNSDRTDMQRHAAGAHPAVRRVRPFHARRHRKASVVLKRCQTRVFGSYVLMQRLGTSRATTTRPACWASPACRGHDARHEPHSIPGGGRRFWLTDGDGPCSMQAPLACRVSRSRALSDGCAGAACDVFRKPHPPG